MAGRKLNTLLNDLGLESIDCGLEDSFEKYLSLLLHWNSRMNLTAIRNEDGILRRHFVESIVCARALPAGITSLLDFGSGAGFPGIPIALCRPEIEVTLSESQGKKAAFLNEAVRVLGISASVHSGRAESMTKRFDCVALRAVDKMVGAVKAAAKLVRPDGLLALMTTGKDLVALKLVVGSEYRWQKETQLPGGDNRLLAIGVREISSPA
jgi:16S rRNA (guanine527-N7)-methyltransferase